MKRYGRRYHGCRVDEFEWRGHRLVVLENERIRLGVLASKGADVVEFRYKPRDLDVLWKAPQVLLPGEYVPTRGREQGSFLDYYTGGWQEIFPAAGPARTVEGADLGQHGEVALLPWDVRVIQDSESAVELAFSVEAQRTPFRLERRMILESGKSFVRVEGRAVNLGEQELPFEWGQHPVLGPPFLERGCRIDLPECRSSPAHLAAVSGPEARTEDVAVCSSLEEGWCAVRNPDQGLAVALAWDLEAFPYLWMWRVYGGAWGYPYFGRAYCLGVEPFSCPPPAPASLAAQAPIRSLRPQQEATSTLELGVFERDQKISGVRYGGVLR